jgi:hypothetical protein
MKQHLKLKLKEILPDQGIPYWADLITDKTAVRTKLHPTIDAVFFKYGLSIWVTKEYKPALGYWTASEIASGLNRIYRLIMQQDTEISLLLIQEIAALPMVEHIEIGRSGNLICRCPQTTSIQVRHKGG